MSFKIIDLKDKIIDEYKQYLIHHYESIGFYEYKEHILKKKDFNFKSGYIINIINNIVKKEIIKYNTTMFEIVCPPYLKIISAWYLKNILKTQYYFEIDENKMKKINKYNGNEKEKYKNIIIFKTIIQQLCDKFGKDIIFCDEFTKQYSIDTFFLLINEFEDFINDKKDKIDNKEIKNIDFITSLNDFYYNKLLNSIVHKNLSSFEDEILTILFYHKKTCENNIFFNGIFNFIFNDILDKCIYIVKYHIF